MLSPLVGDATWLSCCRPDRLVTAAPRAGTVKTEWLGDDKQGRLNVFVL